MSASKKLQADVEKTMKKIEEGIVAFDQTWEQVYEADSQTLREKYETELKKEIKKLQKLREQVKSWVSKGEVRQKQPLIDARERIERRMEQFKECERESKTKAYSKEGLERGMPETPESRKRREAFEYLQECKETLTEEADEMEAEIEELSSKKKPNEERLSELAEALGNHRFHVEKMELLERLLENEVIEPGDIDGLKDDIQYYMEAWKEPDFFPDLDIYEPFESLDRQQSAKNEKARSTQEESSGQEVANQEEATRGTASEASEVKPQSSDTKTGQSSTETSDKTADTKSSGKKGPQSKDHVSEVESDGVSSQTQQTGRTQTRTPTSSAEAASSAPTASLFSPLKKAAQAQPTSQNAAASSAAGTRTVRQGESMAAVLKGAASRDRSDSAQGVDGATAKTRPAANSMQTDSSYSPTPSESFMYGQSSTLSWTKVPAPDEDGIVPGMILDVPTSKVSSEESEKSLAALQASLATLPESRDSERSKSYVPRNPAKTHPSFTTVPMPHLESPALFEKLGLDTLFFIFYYQQGTYQQYLAAQQLKKQRWRFHKKYLTWFRRYQEPEVTSEQYEQGAYVYFDQETGWCSRVRQDFAFEYRFLEDELPN